MENSREKTEGKSQAGFDHFLQRWQSTFAALRRGASAPESWWQGRAAYQELKDRGTTADLIMFPGKEQNDHVRAIYREIQNYRVSAGGIQTHEAAFKDAVSLLNSCEERFSKEQERTPTETGMKRLWSECIEFTTMKRTQVESTRKNYRARILDSPRKLQGIGYDPVTQKETYHTTPEFPFWDAVFSTARYPKRLGRRTELDARLQIRLGALFRFCLPGVSLRTAARLVLFAYGCGELGSVEGTAYRVEKAGKALNVNAVYKRLKLAGLDNTLHMSLKRRRE